MDTIKNIDQQKANFYRYYNKITNSYKGTRFFTISFIHRIIRQQIKNGVVPKYFLYLLEEERFIRQNESRIQRGVSPVKRKKKNTSELIEMYKSTTETPSLDEFESWLKLYTPLQ